MPRRPLPGSFGIVILSATEVAPSSQVPATVASMRHHWPTSRRASASPTPTPVFKSKLVFRGGVGIYVNPYNDYYTPQSYGYSVRPAASPVNQQRNGLTPASLCLANPWPLHQPDPPAYRLKALGFNQNLGGSVTFRPAAVQVPYSERWDLDLQFALSS